MSKRAEEAALKAYPPIAQPFQTTSSKDRRDIYIRAYEQAEKDIIERAVAWLKDNAEKYIAQTTESYPDAPFKAIIGGKCWEDLKKAMEEEE